MDNFIMLSLGVTIGLIVAAIFILASKFGERLNEIDAKIRYLEGSSSRLGRPYTYSQIRTAHNNVEEKKAHDRDATDSQCE